MTAGRERHRPPPGAHSAHSARRAAVVGSLVLAVFAVVLCRLWFLQILSGAHYRDAAHRDRVRTIAIPAPRGEILDRAGAVLVDSRPALAVQIAPARLPVPVSLAEPATLEHPPGRDAGVYAALGRVLGMGTARRRCRLHAPAPNVFRLSPVACQVAQQLTLVPYADPTIDSGRAVAKDARYYLAERRQRYPGVEIRPVDVTRYPDKGLAAQVLGTVGPISQAELAAHAYSGAAPTAIVGQSGLQARYDSYLRGRAGADQIQVDASGEPTGRAHRIPPVAGDNLQLSLDAGVQRVGQASLQRSISDNGGSGGAFVALDPQTGAVYGLGSLPTFDPSVFAGHLSQAAYRRLAGVGSGQPLLNRAIQSVGPPGSTFKPITALAASQSGRWPLTAAYDDTGRYCVGAGVTRQCRHNSSHAAYGVIDLAEALKFSSDIFFYNLGARTEPDPSRSPHGGPLDAWARRFGIGRNPGIDLPGAARGTLPTPAWRARRNRLEAECDHATGPYRYTDGSSFRARRAAGFHRGRTRAPGGCGIADGTDRPWSVGDNISLAIGQGDVQVSPLQLAIVYAALANGGTIVRPHLAETVQAPDGTVLQRIKGPPPRHIDLDPADLGAVRQGLLEAATQPGGTSADVMGTFPEPVYGKTGTAQYIPTSGPDAGIETDYGWYACFVPRSATRRPIVVVVTVERGGFGDISAAPVARQIVSQWFLGTPEPYVAGSSRTL